MKKTASIILTLIMIISLFASCGGEGAAKNERLTIVCTGFPQYDWINAVLGERRGDAEITLLLDGGEDIHNYQPTVADIVKIGSCDLFVYVGGESDKWVGDALESAVNPNIVTVALTDTVAVKTEELTEGMQEEHDHGDADEEGETEYDEHVWLSLRNAAASVYALCDAICTIDGENAELYRENAKTYIAELNELDEEFSATVNAAAKKSVVVADRFPFRYLADDYGLECFAAFPGCSAETEASFETIIFLADKVDELGLTAIFVIENSDCSIAETVAENTAAGCEILELNSCQSVSAEDIANGISYIGIMKENLAALSTALD